MHDLATSIYFLSPLVSFLFSLHAMYTYRRSIKMLKRAVMFFDVSNEMGNRYEKIFKLQQSGHFQKAITELTEAENFFVKANERIWSKIEA